VVTTADWLFSTVRAGIITLGFMGQPSYIEQGGTICLN
jgi:hypothetical protein